MIRNLWHWLLAWRDAIMSLPDAAWLCKAFYDGAVEEGDSE